jgi:hypothetical protein
VAADRGSPRDRRATTQERRVVSRSCSVARCWVRPG